MVALDTQIRETKDQLDESLQADYLCFSRAPFEMLPEVALHVSESFPFHLVSCPVTNKTLLIYFIMPNRAIIFMI